MPCLNLGICCVICVLMCLNLGICINFTANMQAFIDESLDNVLPNLGMQCAKYFQDFTRLLCTLLKIFEKIAQKRMGQYKK